MSAAVVQLKHPVQSEGTTLTEVYLRRPTVKDLKAFDREPGNVSTMAAMIGSLAALPPPVVDSLDAEDFMAISEVVNGFFGNIPPTGGR